MDSEVLRSWGKNGEEWIRAIEGGSIVSRKVTNEAILNVVLESSAESILDLGCGEGWLTRALTNSGKTTMGIDGTLKLVQRAIAKNGGNYIHQTFEEIIAKGDLPGQFDGVVLNFCLYEEEATIDLLKTVQSSLIGRKQVFIQTLHPANYPSGLEYTDQWMEDAWKGLPGAFTEGHPWFFRTLQGWIRTFKMAGLQLTDLLEPKDDSKRPCSIIFILTLRNNG